jgi:hypothetical protein
MSSALKKTYLTVASIVLSVATQANAGSSYASEAACCEPALSCCEEPTCCPSRYYGPNCIPTANCQEVNLRGEVLYWVAMLGGLESAFGTTTIATTVAGGITTTTVTETDREPHWQWRPAYRVGIDYGFGCFVLEADWTHYVGRAHFNDDGQSGRWKIRYDTIDLLFGRRFSIAPCFYFKPFIGARGLLVHQRLHSNLQTLFTALIGDNTVFTYKDDKERTWGVGPELGVEADWYMGGNLSLYGSFDVVSYYGRVKTQIYDTDVFTSTVSVSDGTIKRDFNVIGTDLSFGIRFDTAWQVASEVLLTMKLGVEQHRIYDFSNLGSDGTLDMSGANLALTIGYSY